MHAPHDWQIRALGSIHALSFFFRAILPARVSRVPVTQPIPMSIYRTYIPHISGGCVKHNVKYNFRLLCTPYIWPPHVYIWSYAPTLTALIRASKRDLSHSTTVQNHYITVGQAKAAGALPIVIIKWDDVVPPLFRNISWHDSERCQHRFVLFGTFQLDRPSKKSNPPIIINLFGTVARMSRAPCLHGATDVLFWQYIDLGQRRQFWISTRTDTTNLLAYRCGPKNKTYFPYPPRSSTLFSYNARIIWLFGNFALFVQTFASASVV